jgi:hypothetical protein
MSKTPRCLATAARGGQCTSPAWTGYARCRAHQALADPALAEQIAQERKRGGQRRHYKPLPAARGRRRTLRERTADPVGPSRVKVPSQPTQAPLVVMAPWMAAGLPAGELVALLARIEAAEGKPAAEGYGQRVETSRAHMAEWPAPAPAETEIENEE